MSSVSLKDIPYVTCFLLLLDSVFKGYTVIDAYFTCLLTLHLTCTVGHVHVRTTGSWCIHGTQYKKCQSLRQALGVFMEQKKLGSCKPNNWMRKLSNCLMIAVHFILLLFIYNWQMNHLCREAEEWANKRQAAEVYMMKCQIQELIESLKAAQERLPASCTSIQKLSLSSLDRWYKSFNHINVKDISFMWWWYALNQACIAWAAKHSSLYIAPCVF